MQLLFVRKIEDKSRIVVAASTDEVDNVLSENMLSICEYKWVDIDLSNFCLTWDTLVSNSDFESLLSEIFASIEDWKLVVVQKFWEE